MRPHKSASSMTRSAWMGVEMKRLNDEYRRKSKSGKLTQEQCRKSMKVASANYKKLARSKTSKTKQANAYNVQKVSRARTKQTSRLPTDGVYGRFVNNTERIENLDRELNEAMLMESVLQEVQLLDERTRNALKLKLMEHDPKSSDQNIAFLLDFFSTRHEREVLSDELNNFRTIEEVAERRKSMQRRIKDMQNQRRELVQSLRDEEAKFSGDATHRRRDPSPERQPERVRERSPPRFSHQSPQYEISGPQSPEYDLD